ncbi:MAG: tryptophan synthase subunit alpha [Methanobacteriota archaeon]|nr:MAG: tryptophan synthase subunit alpha [Euryarchaeota archaeon]
MTGQISDFMEKYLEGRKLLVGYWVLGYPDFSTSIKIMEQIGRHGADIVEIGFPYSDPVADGHAIQNASAKALKNGIDMETLWEAVQQIGRYTSPFLMTYGNIAFQYGIERFHQKAVENGLQGVIFPDIPPSLYPSRLKELNPAFIVSPNVSLERAKMLTKESRSFVYFLSGLATTGGYQRFDKRLSHILETVKNVNKDIPALVGFGISDIEGVQTALELGFDGVIMGSALLRTFETNGEDAVSKMIDDARKTLDDFKKVRAIL